VRFIACTLLRIPRVSLRQTYTRARARTRTRTRTRTQTQILYSVTVFGVSDSCGFSSRPENERVYHRGALPPRADKARAAFTRGGRSSAWFSGYALIGGSSINDEATNAELNARTRRRRTRRMRMMRSGKPGKIAPAPRQKRDFIP